MGLTRYLRNAENDHLFGNAEFVQPTVFVFLSTADPGVTGAGLAEPTAESYAAVETENSDWTESVDGVVTNVADIEFPAPAENWGLITHGGLKDGDGNVLASAELPTAQNVTAGSTAPIIAAGKITLTRN
jgi:hypothetical protein